MFLLFLLIVFWILNNEDREVLYLIEFGGPPLAGRGGLVLQVHLRF